MSTLTAQRQTSIDGSPNSPLVDAHDVADDVLFQVRKHGLQRPGEKEAVSTKTSSHGGVIYSLDDDGVFVRPDALDFCRLCGV